MSNVRRHTLMNHLCLLTGLTSSEWAAWVQAVGSISAIIGATWIAIWQSRRQHAISRSVMREERRLERTEVARALLALSINCAHAVDHGAKQFPDRVAVHEIAEQATHFDFNELRIIENAVLGIPLYSLPHKLVPLAMILSSTVRQFREKVESALLLHREMDAGAFGEFFAVLGSMQRSLASTCRDIEAEVERSNSEA